ncbi:hypothetical protein MCC10004_1365 [Bifidobacterium longum subsp. longum]|uniref:Uncharacterized protein n=1 Tax=Bifidobacterium longum subsp. longum TaxID=1679 RepID=A0A4R0SBN8_BIFLL|nr:hypothetical protein MCC10004_1365 [Bifidobacterium longum subsp. longum]
MLIPSMTKLVCMYNASLSRRVNANSQLGASGLPTPTKLIKKGEC